MADVLHRNAARRICGIQKHERLPAFGPAVPIPYSGIKMPLNTWPLDGSTVMRPELETLAVPLAERGRYAFAVTGTDRVALCPFVPGVVPVKERMRLQSAPISYVPEAFNC